MHRTWVRSDSARSRGRGTCRAMTNPAFVPAVAAVRFGSRTLDADWSPVVDGFSKLPRGLAGPSLEGVGEVGEVAVAQIDGDLADRHGPV